MYIKRTKYQEHPTIKFTKIVIEIKCFKIFTTHPINYKYKSNTISSVNAPFTTDTREEEKKTHSFLPWKKQILNNVRQATSDILRRGVELRYYRLFPPIKILFFFNDNINCSLIMNYWNSIQTKTSLMQKINNNK